MLDVGVNREEELGNTTIDISQFTNYQKAIRFADDDLKQKLEKYKLSATQKFIEMLEKKIWTIVNKKDTKRERLRRNHLLKSQFFFVGSQVSI